MRRIRVIPVLLINEGKLVKSIRFKNHKYVGDPINAVKIFNEKEVDELAILDISATREKRQPNLQMIREIAGEAFMPLAYGGGISHIDQVKEILYNGIEKVIVNRSAIKRPELISQVAERFGSQAIVASIDVKKNIWGKYRVYSENGSASMNYDPVAFARECVKRGAGEILLNSIDRDGTYNGFDLDILNQVSSAVNVPVIACGGAGSIADFRRAVQEGNASAVSAGSMFVFKRPHNAVLISYPSQKDLKEQLYSAIG